MLLIVKAASTIESDRASLSISSTANARAMADIEPVTSVRARARKNHRKLRSCIAASLCTGSSFPAASNRANGPIPAADGARCATRSQ